MWDFIKHTVVGFWPEILIVGMIVCCFVSILAVARLEKHFIRQYVTVVPQEMPLRSPYFLAMNEAAPALGFRHCGDFLQSRGSSLYKCCIAFWMSADQDSLLVIGGGKLARIDYKRTMLISVVNDEKVLVTMDDFGVTDLSGIRDIDVILNGDLSELHARHAQRINLLAAPPKPFPSSASLQQYEDLEQLRVEKLVSVGLAEFLDMSHSVWRYNFKGAWGNAYTGYLMGLKKAQGQADRLKKKRPGS